MTAPYPFDPARCVIFDVEVFPGRWCVGFLGPDRPGRERHVLVDGDPAKLGRVLRRVAKRDLTLVGYNSRDYDLPMIRAILAGEDPYEISREIISHDGFGLPEGVRRRLGAWPKVRADHIDLCARTRDMGRFPSLKTVGANLGFPRLRELPSDPDRVPDDAAWSEVVAYNRVDLDLTAAVLEHFSPDLEAIAELSRRFGCDLRSVHQAGIARRILCNAYRRRHGVDPGMIAVPESVRYVPPAIVRRPRDTTAGLWYDRLTTEDFPMVPGAKGGPAKPVVPEPPGPILIGGMRISVGQGGINSVDGPTIHRGDEDSLLVEADVSSFYPALIDSQGITPRGLGDCGQELFREILTTRLEVKRRSGEATDPEESRRLKVQAYGLKIVLNSTFGQYGNPYRNPLYDPEAFLAVTLSGQLLLIDLLERLEGTGVVLLSIHTDGLVFRTPRGDRAWEGVLEGWQAETGMTLEVGELAALATVATHTYASVSAAGALKRKGGLGDAVDWSHVPNFRVVADAVVATLLRGTLPERTIRECFDPFPFTAVVRRERRMAGVLIDEATGAEGPIPRLVRFYKAKGSTLRIEHRWTTDDGKAHATTPTNAREIGLLMDLPDRPPEDLDRSWYVGEARRRILDHPGIAHLDPRWLEGHETPKDLLARGLVPAPKWAGKNLPVGAKVDRPSFFWPWDDYDTFGTYTGPSVGVLVLDVDEPDKFRAWVDSENDPLLDDRWRALDAACVSYHPDDGPGAVRAGRGRGKLIFRLAAGPDHPLARIAVNRWKKARGVEVFFGKGVPTVLGAHPEGPGREYLLDGTVGEAPAWLIEGLIPKAKTLARRRPSDAAADGTAMLEEAAAHVAAISAGHGLRNGTLFSEALRVGAAVAAGTIDRAEAEGTLVDASTLPPDEARGVVRRALDYKAADNGDDRGGDEGTPGGRRPVVAVDTELWRLLEEILALLPLDPDLYRRGHILVRLVKVSTPTHKLHGGVELRGTSGLPVIVPVEMATLKCRLARLADFVRWERTKKGEEIAVPCHPPEIPVLAALNHVAYPGVRAIEGIVEVPYFRPDGTLTPPGYDDRTGTLYVPGVGFEPLSDAPTEGDARAAARRLFAPVAQFPFATDEDRAVWLAAVLGLVARPMISGPVPGIAFIGNRAGIGKGKLVNAAGLIALGRTIPTTMYPVTKEETIKTKVALALAAATAVFFDNLEDGSTYGNGPLDSSITDLTLNERILGMSKTTGEIELRPCWFLSGNNIGPAKDAYRRWLVCNLKSLLENPEERPDLEIKDLPGHILKHRGELLRDVLIILKAHALAKRPTGGWAPLGSFEEWDPIVRGAVWFATGWDCNRSRKAAAAEAPERLKRLALLDAWESIPGGGGDGGGIRVRSAHERATTTDDAGKILHPDLHDAFMGFGKDGKFPSPETIGRTIGGMADVLLDGKMFKKMDKVNNALIWKVVRP